MGRKRWKRKRSERKAIAEERVRILSSLAEDAVAAGERGYADRYGWLARRIAMRYKVRMERGYRVVYCKRCGAYCGGSESRVRLRGKTLVRTCLRCGSVYRHPLRDTVGSDVSKRTTQR